MSPARGRTALTLVELLIAISLLSVVMLATTSVLISFKKFFVDAIDQQNQVGDAAVFSVEDITYKIMTGSAVSVVSATDIRITVGTNIHEYFLSGTTLKYYTYPVGGSPPANAVTMAKNITLANFQLNAYNRIGITLGLTPVTGAKQQVFTTSVVVRAAPL
ncbi:MAG: prepilin-type N-terminal cleavage/methylation domain-containing protein [Candidatus Omnitrophota bacterium]